VLADLTLGHTRGEIVLGRDRRDMLADASFDAYELPFSRFVAEALIARDGPQEISDRADRLGLPLVARDVAVAACVGTACDCSLMQLEDATEASL
jgi:hypothetical protein